MDGSVSSEKSVNSFRHQLELLALEYERAHTEAFDLAQENHKLRTLLQGLDPSKGEWKEDHAENEFITGDRRNPSMKGSDLESQPLTNGFNTGKINGLRSSAMPSFQGPEKVNYHSRGSTNGFTNVDDDILDEYRYHHSSSWEQVRPENHATMKPSVNSVDPASLIVEVTDCDSGTEEVYDSEIAASATLARSTYSSAASATSADSAASSHVVKKMSTFHSSSGSQGTGGFQFVDIGDSRGRKSVAARALEVMTRDSTGSQHKKGRDGSWREMPRASVFDRVYVIRASFGVDGDSKWKRCSYVNNLCARLCTCRSALSVCSNNSVHGLLLTWGICTFLCILLELWLIPIELIFFEKCDMPHAIDYMLDVLAAIFTMDIVINLWACCMQGDQTRWHLLFFPEKYIWFWLLVDVSAAAPAMTLLITDITASMSEASKAREVLTCLRLLHTLRLVRMAQQAKSIIDALWMSDFRLTCLVVSQAVLILIILAHVHGCIWAALQPEWVAVGTVIEAFRQYFHSFWWAYTALTAGALGSLGSRQVAGPDRPGLWALEIVMASERLLIILLLAVQVLGNGAAAPRFARQSSGQADFADSGSQLALVQRVNTSLKRGGSTSTNMSGFNFSSSTGATSSMALDIDSDSDEELGQAPPFESGSRRGGVSAEATAAFAHRYQDNEMERKVEEQVKLADKRNPSQEDRPTLIAGLQRLPFLYNVQALGIEALVDTMYMEDIPAGEWVYRKGDIGRSIYINVDGVAVSVDEDDGIETRFLHPKDVFGEFTMLWGFRREHSVRAHADLRVGKLKRDSFFHLVTQHELIKMTQKQSILRKIRLFDMLNDEMICKLTDVLERRSYPAGTKILSQGDESSQELFLVWDGMCVSTTSRQSAVPREMRRLKKGEYFGETGFLREGVAHQSVSALGKVKVLVLTAKKFTRMFGDFHALAEDLLKRDPRTAIADFYRPGDKFGPRGLNTRHTYANLEISHRSEWFAVFRPTSRDAIAKMIDGIGVGKGLNIKGKSSKMNNLSGFVPFLQISNNDHKSEVEKSPSDARTTIYYQSKWGRSLALQVLEPLLKPQEGLDVLDRSIIPDDQYDGIFGLNLPEAAVREAYIMRPDIRYPQGWDSGRPSEPAYMNMNMHSARSSSEPKVVLYQFDQLDPLNPHGLLIAYAESTVKPVVSDFDLFTVGCKGVLFEIELEPSQCNIAMWMLTNAREVLRDKEAVKNWSTKWLEVMKHWHEQGFHPEPPRFGFGDRLSNSLVSALVQKTQHLGAVRHGAECFNLYFPQELDTEYLIVWEGFESRWEYFQEADMREFLKDRVGEGYSFPLNPVWPVRDAGWYDLYKALRNSSTRAVTFDRWYPPGSDITTMIESIYEDRQYVKLVQEKEGRETHRERTQRLNTQRRLASMMQKG